VSRILSYISGEIPLRGVENPLKEKIMSRNKYRQFVDHKCFSVPVINDRPQQTPLDAIQTLIYGFLVFRSRKNRSASRTEIGRNLRLDRAAVTRAIKSLAGLGVIVEAANRQWLAVEPAEPVKDLFRFRTQCNGEWQSRFVYDRVCIPQSSSVLSVKTNALFWRLYKLGRAVQSMPGYLQAGGHAECPVPYFTNAYLAKGLRCHRTTISKGLQRLKRLGLIWTHKIDPSIHPDGFVVGIPPITSHLDLWRKKRSHKATSVVVTAQQLFGVPSAMVVAPKQTDRNDPEAHFVASRIPTREIQILVAMIEEHSIGVDIWRPLLKKASAKHEEYKASNPSAVDHCGFLFKKMLEDRVKADVKRQVIAPTWTPPTYDEVNAGTAMDDMRLPPEGRRLLRSAVTSESLSLKDDGCVPCSLNWEKVVAVHKKTKGDWALFQQAIIQSIFSFPSDRPPSCVWYEQWLSVEPIPKPDNTPLVEAGVPESDARELRSTVDEWISTFIEDERQAVEYGDGFIWLAAKQMTGRPSIKTAAAALASIAADVRPLELSPNDDGLDGGSPLRFRRY
jgi:predicted transcriptional regulator